VRVEDSKEFRHNIRKWALKCAHEVRFAIPAKVIVNVLREYPALVDEKGELMNIVREVCTEVNKLKDKQIEKEMHKYTYEETTIFE